MEVNLNEIRGEKSIITVKKMELNFDNGYLLKNNVVVYGREKEIN